MVITELNYFEFVEQETLIIGGSKKMSHLAIGSADAKAILSSIYGSSYSKTSVLTLAGRLPDGSLGSYSTSTSLSIASV